MLSAKPQNQRFVDEQRSSLWQNVNRWFGAIRWPLHVKSSSAVALYHHNERDTTAAAEPAARESRPSSEFVTSASIDGKLLERAHDALQTWHSGYAALPASLRSLDGLPHARDAGHDSLLTRVPNVKRSSAASYVPGHLFRRTQSQSSLNKLPYEKEIHDVIYSALRMKMVLEDIIAKSTPEITMPQSAPKRGAVSSPLMSKAYLILSGEGAFEKLSLLDQYYEVCRLIKLLDEEFDDSSREYLDALIAREAQDAEAMLEGDERDLTIQRTTDSPTFPRTPTLDDLIASSNVPGEHASTHTSVDQMLRDLGLQDLDVAPVVVHTSDIMNAQQLDVGASSSDALSDTGQTYPASQVSRHLDSRTAHQGIPYGCDGNAVNMVRSMGSGSHTDLMIDDYSTYIDLTPEMIINNYPSTTAEYEHQLAALRSLRMRLEEQCRKEGQKIEMYRDATDIPLAKDNNTLWDGREIRNVVDTSTHHEIALSPDDAFSKVTQDIEVNLPAGIDVEHISRARQQNASPPPEGRERIKNAVAQWAEDVSISTEHLAPQEQNQMPADLADLEDQQQTSVNLNHMPDSGQTLPDRNGHQERES